VISTDVLQAIAAAAPALDDRPAFPAAAFAALGGAGLLDLTLAPGPRAAEWAAVRAVAAADGSVGRLFEGHLNAVERLRVHAPALLDGTAGGRTWLGVWGADPAPGEGEPARLSADRRRVDGVKVFCSGAGGLHRALVTARAGAGAPCLVYVDLESGATVDSAWFAGLGMRASVSHRVVFDGAPVLGVLGEPGALVAEPWFSRDAIRTAAAWAGIADAAAGAALRDLAARGPVDDLRAHAAGEILTARGTLDAWLAHAAAVADSDPDAPLRELSVALRAGIARAGADILAGAARACGSRPFATGTALDRARRDFELFVLQHRLDPQLARLGRDALR
jgi:hypothetical protein